MFKLLGFDVGMKDIEGLLKRQGFKDLMLGRRI